MIIVNDLALANDHRPKEKLSSQLNTITPMEIVRTQPFFSRHSLTLRDKLDEYVHGFPATKVHRQIIAKAYNIDLATLGDINETQVTQNDAKSQSPYRSLANSSLVNSSFVNSSMRKSKPAAL